MKRKKNNEGKSVWKEHGMESTVREGDAMVMGSKTRERWEVRGENIIIRELKGYK